MPKDPGDRLVHQVRASASHSMREASTPQGMLPTDSPSFDSSAHPDLSSPQPIDLDMELFGPDEDHPGSPATPLSPIDMDDDTQLGILSVPISLASTDSFEQQANIVTSSLHTIADWLETVDWDTIFGRNPLDAATLNSTPLASAATRVIRYLNAGIAGRSTKVPDLQVPPVQPNRVNNPSRMTQPATHPTSATSTRPDTPGAMSYASAVSRSSQAPSVNYTNWTTSRTSSRQAHPELSPGELLALQRQIAATRPPRPHRVTLPRGARRAVHVIFTGIKPDPIPRPGVVVQAVNSYLPAARAAFRAASANWSSRHNVTIQFAQNPEDSEINAVRAALGALFPNIPPSTYSVDKRHIISTVMFHRLALTYPDGSPITAEEYTQELKASVAWQEVRIPRPPRLVPDKDTHVGTLYVDFHDNGALSTLRQVIREPALLQGEAVYPVKYHKRDTVPQCSHCLRWGHASPICHSKTYRCNHCGGNHLEQDHRQWAACCHGTNPTPGDAPCPHPPTCVNCGAAHKANDRACPFYEHRHSREWINQHQPRAPTTRPPSPSDSRRDTHIGPVRPYGPSRNRRPTPARAHVAHRSQASAGASRPY
ncbi:hypothetical protein HETIRDRAFT_316207 [Heterobasidion irregulare TC 32-1]|uniref:Uncharacterized protein n=1 Tax=Heterobasidion irregulare (strain TC 32-1) TaxID=747525 RepID=W4JR87_HETIT|nr:uncharacterized protein HETIRDRAFT_316207 [Heterobasidion irregulare TC 32-1]XP_009552996.1 uncharacterized protein HETIRDRAFT_331456 [Heterobasidion irregulare TC 32-1]ETW75600.1 hypothetical protein HETIRDRAFT_331456 [Heterobasidion irregulare TC 32-1]ETW82411.1 hypothetical protein HETIRDRAFT_316207 [Heterobasidion irregulare TC 32-1]